MKSYLLLKKYYKIHFLSLQASKFIKISNLDIAKIDKIRCAIHSPKMEATQFLYLFLYTKKLPQLHKYYTNSINFIRDSSRTQKSIDVATFLKKRIYWKFLYQQLFSIFSNQPILETNVFQITMQQIRLFIETMPLTENTFRLQSPHHYIALLPFSINITFKSTTLFEKLYIFKTLKILKIPSYIPTLSEFSKN